MKLYIDTEPLYLYPQGGIPIYTLKLMKELSKFKNPPFFISSYATCRNSVINKIQKNINDN